MAQFTHKCLRALTRFFMKDGYCCTTVLGSCLISAFPHAAGRGDDSQEGGWQSGLFDRGSWWEAQEGWARTVVTGRARLGGVPVGVVAVETQMVMRHVPADPGMPDSSEQDLPQAGQVSGAAALLGYICRVGTSCIRVYNL